jgi:hypothetical protein
MDRSTPRISNGSSVSGPDWEISSDLSRLRGSREHDSHDKYDHAHKKEKDSAVQIPKPCRDRPTVRRVGLGEVREQVLLEDLRGFADEPQQLDRVRRIGEAETDPSPRADGFA